MQILRSQNQGSRHVGGLVSSPDRSRARPAQASGHFRIWQLTGEPNYKDICIKLMPSQINRVCTLAMSDKGLRFSSSHLDTEQIQLYLPRSCFEAFQWFPGGDDGTEGVLRMACHVNALLESLHLGLAPRSKTSAPLSYIELVWAGNVDHLAISYRDILFLICTDPPRNPDGIFQVLVEVPSIEKLSSERVETILAFPANTVNFQIIASGTAIAALFSDVAQGNAFTSLTFESEPGGETLSISASYPNGSMELRRCLTSPGIDQSHCQNQFRTR